MVSEALTARAAMLALAERRGAVHSDAEQPPTLLAGRVICSPALTGLTAASIMVR